MAIDRRRFLQLSAIGLAATFVESGCQMGDMRGLQYDHPQLLAMLGPDRLRQLGERYVAQTPKESSTEALEAAISKNRGFRIFGQSIDDMIHEDFVEGRTVVVDGWVLSVTEARQAALFAVPHKISARAY